MESKEKYAAYFGRAPDVVLDPNSEETLSPSVYRFPPTRVGLFGRFFTPLASDFVFVTDGMSRHTMSVPPDEKDVYPSRVELLACAKRALGVGPDGRDVVTTILQRLAVLPLRDGIFFGPLQTFDLGERMNTATEMTGFLFGVPDGVDMKRLCSCTPGAKLVISVVPVTANEIRYARDLGSDRLIARFEEAGVEAIFDPFRKGVVP